MYRLLERSIIATAIAAVCIIGSGGGWFESPSGVLLAQAQPPGGTMPGPIIEDPPGPYAGQSYVPVPSNLIESATPLSNFIVTYNGFSAQAQAAFQAAVDVWAAQIQSPVPIFVTATWSTTLPSNVLGSAGAATLVRDFPGAISAGTWFPIALADKLSGTDLNPGSADIVANFNANFSWYYGTDGNAGGNYDLMSVVLHELGHGLGFFGSMTVSTVNGSWGLGTGLPVMYDRFALNSASQLLIDSYPNPSVSLGAQLVSNVFFGGANARNGNGGNAPKLYTPSVWQQGSSYSHLNESTFPAGTLNSLMTPQMGAGEAIHDPGPIVRGAFIDMGWTVPPPCSYSLSSALANVGPAAATGSFGVTTGANCGWTASSNSGFLAITGGSSGTGNGTVSYAVSANNGAARNGTLTVGGRTFTVVQAVRGRGGDFDGDGKADLTVFRPSTGAWHTVKSVTGTPTSFSWGNSADKPLAGDYDGDGKMDVAVFRPSNGTWYVVPSTTGVPYSVAWGNSADTPVPGDYDGDGRTDIAVFRPSNGTWYIVPSTTGAAYGFAWGNGADLPVPGDYDGDGRMDIAVFRPSNGTWYVVPSTTAAPYGFAWGNGADITVPGDYDGDGKTDIAVFRPSNGTWYIVPSATGMAYGFAWGNGADIPVPGDYDGDGKTDIAVFRPSNGTWYVVPSTTGVAYGFAWGNGADVPILKRP